MAYFGVNGLLTKQMVLFWYYFLVNTTAKEDLMIPTPVQIQTVCNIYSLQNFTVISCFKNFSNNKAI
jgi:hypothetical protein